MSIYNNVLVLGGTGFLGKNLQKVRPDWIYVGRTSFVENGIECSLEDLKTAYVGNETDYTDIHTVGNLIGVFNPDAVINLAGDVGGIAYNNVNQLSIFENNIMMNTNIIKVCRELEIERVLSCLSTCAFPDCTPACPMSEDDLFWASDQWQDTQNAHPYKGHTGYGWAKRMLHIHTELAREAEYNYSTFAPSNLYGPHDHMGEIASHFVAALIHKVHKAKDELRLYGDGKALRQFLYAPDLAGLIPTLLEKHNSGSPLIVAPEENLSIDEMARIALKVVEKDVKIKYSGEHAGQHRKDCSNSRLKKLLNDDVIFTSFEEGFRETYNWYLENK